MASNSNRRSASSGSTSPRGVNNPRYANAPKGGVPARAPRGSDGRARAGGVPRTGGVGTSGASRVGAPSGPTRRASGAGSASPRPTARPVARAGGRSSARSPQLTSVRIGDIDRMERRSERAAAARAKSRKPLIIVSVVAALVLALVVAFFVLSRSSVFIIENVDVVGAEHLTTSEVSALIEVPQGTTLLNVDASSIESSLLRDAWVKDVTINRVFPSTLQVVITERDIAAVVEIPMGSTQTIQNWAIASDGMWLMVIPSQDSEVGQSLSPKIYEDEAEALHITGVPYGLEPEIGTYCTDENVNNALSIVSGMTTELADQVKTVTATDPESTLLTLDSGVEIAFGTADDIREKELICQQIMQENEGKVAYINVRVVSRPTWRAV